MDCSPELPDSGLRINNPAPAELRSYQRKKPPERAAFLRVSCFHCWLGSLPWWDRAARPQPGTRHSDLRFEPANGSLESFLIRVRYCLIVAIKVLPSFFASDSERLERFEQEARAAAALNHTNILAVFQMGTHQGAPYLVSELLEGETLRAQLKRGCLAVRKAIDYGVQTARGLAAAHEKGIVHRDPKPENLFVTKDGRVKILDFGLAKLTQRHASSDPGAPTFGVDTEVGAIMGTVGYMAPEQVRGEAADHRADIFAFGAILCEILAGKRSVSEADVARDDDGNPQRRPAGDFAGCGEHSARIATGVASLPGEEPGAALPVGLGPGVCSGGVIGHIEQHCGTFK
jgi:serine/threonine protein kinase